MLRSRRLITAKGIKPITPYQQRFQNTYLYGAFSPVDRHSFLLDLPYCNTEMMQLFISQFSLQRPDELKILLLDNASFHTTDQLIFPRNVIPLFIPPYTPELNPAEKVWHRIKDQITFKPFKDLKQLQYDLYKTINNSLSCHRIKSLTRYHYIKNSLSAIY